jgi:hypothetical protein
MAPGGQAPGSRDEDGAGPGSSTETVRVPPTDAQAAFLAGLGQRARDCQDGLVPPDQDHVLGVMSRERRASLDMRLVGREMDGPGKLAGAAARIGGRWRERGGLQVVFCEDALHGAPLAAWDAAGELAALLAEEGILASAVRFPRGARGPGAIAALAGECAAGAVAVLAGGTRDLIGVPGIQRLIVAAHHLDVPCTAREAASRAALDPGQPGEGCGTFRYVTEGSSEASGWQAIDAGTDPAAAALQALTGRPAAVARHSTAPARPAPHGTRGRGAGGPARGL